VFYFKKILLLVCLSISSSPSSAEIYFWQDSSGKKHYSDKPSANAKAYQKSTHKSYFAIKTIYDGDTVQLSDGRKIRLLGINTPEIAHRNNRAEQGGYAAKLWLEKALKNKKVRLELGAERQDKYKRYLGHLFTEEGLHINLELVRLGLASASIYPPNLGYVDVLSKASDTAEQQNLGIWHYADYKAKKASQLNAGNKQGWQRILGRITHIKQTKKNSYLSLSNKMSLRIKRADLALFGDIELLRGKTVEARGWVHRYKDKFTMLLRHPSALKIK